MTEKCVFVVGLDGATWKVINPLLKRNKLPFIKTLLKKSKHGVLKSTVPPLTATAWTSFQTGLSPTEHGVFGFLNYRENPLKPKIFNSTNIPKEKIWNGTKSLIVNMPLTYPLQKMNGITVSSFLTPPGEDYVYPKKYQNKLDSMGYKIDLLVEEKYGLLNDKKYSHKESREMLNKLVEISKKRAETFKYLAKGLDFGFYFILFKGTDLAQHLFWGTKFLKDYYIEIDKILLDLYTFYEKIKSKEKSFLVISDHGFHASAKYEFSPQAFLFKNNGDFVKGNFKSLLNKTQLSKLKIIQKARNEYHKKGKQNVIENEGYLITPEGIYVFDDKFDTENLIKRLKNAKYNAKYVFKFVKRSVVMNSPDILWLTNEEFMINTSVYESRPFKKRVNYLKGDHTSDVNGIFVADGDIDKKINNNLKIYELGKLIGNEFIDNSHIIKANDVVNKTFDRFGNNIGVAFTGRKDSSVMLHLIKASGNKIPKCLFIDHRLHFKESYETLKKFEKDWNLEIIKMYDKKLVEEIKKEKNLDKKRELLNKYKILMLDKAIKENKWKALFVSIRRDENDARKKEKYFSRRRDHYRIHPMLSFSESDIWSYIRENKIYYNPLYDRGYRSIGDKIFTKKSISSERSGRDQKKEKVMQRLRALGYF